MRPMKRLLELRVGAPVFVMMAGSDERPFRVVAVRPPYPDWADGEGET
jgi:hypothetical protein